MRAVRFYEYGGVDRLIHEEVPDPIPGAGEVLIRVRACGVNRVDTEMRSGVARLPLKLPHTLGFEFSGEIVALGEGVTDWELGDRVTPLFELHCGNCTWCSIGEHQHCINLRMHGVHIPGGYAELRTAPAWSLIAVPKSLSHTQAAAIQVTYVTAWHALVPRGGIKAGMTVLIMAAGSGVGSAGVQIAAHKGATVIATAGGAEKLERAITDGAAHGVNYRDPDWGAQVLAITKGRGVDLILESVGGELFTDALQTLAKFGKIVTVGGHAGERVQIDVVPFRRGEESIIGSVRGTADEARALVKMVGEGIFRPVIAATYPLAEAARAHTDLAERRNFGKIVLTP